jgi:hypothetical protein
MVILDDSKPVEQRKGGKKVNMFQRVSLADFLRYPEGTRRSDFLGGIHTWPEDHAIAHRPALISKPDRDIVWSEVFADEYPSGKAIIQST